MDAAQLRAERVVRLQAERARHFGYLRGWQKQVAALGGR
jgi:hypothetical protein